MSLRSVSGFESYLDRWERHVGEAWGIGRDFRLPGSFRNISHVLFCGIGGSAIGGDIVRVLFQSRAAVPFEVRRAGMGLPAWAGPRTLVVLSSYSGNTREILEAFGEASKAGARILIVTSGGRLAKAALRKKIPWIKIPGGFQPRCAIVYLTIPILWVFKKAGLLPVAPGEIREAASIARKVSRSRARSLARRLFSKNIHLYAASGTLEPVAVRWRTQLAENAKTLASHNLMPEMFHNEIEAWQFPKGRMRDRAAVFFSDPEDPKVFGKKIKFAAAHIRRKGAGVIQLRPSGRGLLARIFSLILAGDWVSLELARLYRADPTTIPVLDAVKKIG